MFPLFLLAALRMLWGVFTDGREEWQLRRAMMAEFGRWLRDCLPAGFWGRLLQGLRAVVWQCLCATWWLLTVLFGAFVLWPAGWWLAHREDDEAQSGVMEVITLFGYVLAYSVALIVLQQKTTVTRAWTIIVYDLIAGVSLVAMICMLRAEPNLLPAAGGAPVGRYHAYDRKTVMFTRVLFVGCSAIVVCLSWLAAKDQLPGQAFTYQYLADFATPTTVSLRDSSGELSTKGVMIPVELNRAVLGDKPLPEKLNMYITLPDKLAQNWQVYRVVGEARDGKEWPPEDQPTVAQTNKERHETEVTLRGLKPDGKYFLKVYLKGAGRVDEKEAHAAIDLIEQQKLIDKEKRSLRISFNTREK